MRQLRLGNACNGTDQSLRVSKQALLGGGKLGRQLRRRLVLVRGHGGVCEGAVGLRVRGLAEGAGLDILEEGGRAHAEPQRRQNGGEGDEEGDGCEEELGEA